MTDIRVGDTVTITHRGVVEKINEFGEPKVNGQYHYVSSSQLCGNAKRANLKVIKRAKPKAGDVITGKELCATPLRRGTIVAFKDFYQNDMRFVLHADGNWHSLDNTGHTIRFDLDHISAGEDVEMVFVA